MNAIALTYPMISKAEFNRLRDSGVEVNVLVGIIGVDSGLVWIGDPCYIMKDTPETDKLLTKAEERPKSIGANWREFCDILHEGGFPTMKSFRYDLGHEGLGVCCSTSGDGAFPVIATFGKDGINRIQIEFMSEEMEKYRGNIYRVV